MTKPNWYFREFKPGDNASDPAFTRALFSGDESEAARSLVREAVQNSLDARSEAGRPVRVRFALRTAARAAASGSVRTFFSGLWPHLASPDCGVTEPPDRHGAVPYVIIEDFGTHGLTGDPSVWDPFDAKQNAFFLFFRALGHSGKKGEDRGRWGVGKFVFPMMSRVHALLGVSIPAGQTNAMVMGRAVLRTHRVDETSFHPDGHWGIQDESGLVVPVSDPESVREVERTFDLKRGQEPGLSVIVPWVHESITAGTLTKAIAAEYFLPVLREELIVEIDDNGSTQRIDAERMFELAKSLDDPLVQARVELGLQAATWPPGKLIQLAVTGGGSRNDWSTKRITEEQRSLISKKLEEGEVAALRVVAEIQKKGGEYTTTFFDVFIRQVPRLGRVKPLIVREGIAISGDKTTALQDYASLIIVDDPPIATFVGDAESPAHTELQSVHVTANYGHARQLITFLRKAPAAIIREVEGGDEEADLSLLAEFFPRPGPAAIPRTRKPKAAPDGSDTLDTPELPQPVRKVAIAQVQGGFTIKGTDAIRPGEWLSLECAYDIRRGNPMRKYRNQDFIIGRDITVDATGISVKSKSENRLEAEVQDAAFVLRLAGFDPNRNVVIRVNVSDGGALE